MNTSRNSTSLKKSSGDCLKLALMYVEVMFTQWTFHKNIQQRTCRKLLHE